MDPVPPRAPHRELFYGRAAELALLTECFHRAQRGPAQVCLVGGASGIGKTALIQRFLEAPSEPGGAGRPTLALRARCFERETAPFKPVGALLRDLVRRLEALPEARAGLPLPPELVQMFPALAPLRSDGAKAPLTPAPAEPLAQRQRAFAALRALFGHLQAHSAIILFVDDLHWADEDSLLLLEQLLAAREPPGLLFLASYRTEGLDGSALFRGFLERHGADPETHRVLAPLPAGDTDALARGLLAREVSPDSQLWGALLGPIVRESAGSPLLVEELVRYLRRRLGAAGGGGLPAEALESLELGHVLRARIAELPERVRELLEVIAVAGDPVPQAVVMATLGGEVAPAEWITRLRSESLVRRDGPEGRHEVDTLHDRIRDAVVAPLPSERRQEIHRRLAEAMQRLDPERVDFLAKHWQAAGDPARALHFLTEVARRAVRQLAFQRAAELYSQAIALEEEPGAAALLQEALGAVLANQGRLEEAAEAYLAAAEGAEPERRLTLRLRAGEQLLRGGHMARGFEVLGQVLREMGYPLARSPGWAVFSILRNRAWLALRGLKQRQRQAAQQSELDALYAAAAYISVVDTIHGADLQNRYLRRAAAAGDPAHFGLALALEGTHQATLGAKRFDQGRALLTRAGPLVAAHAEPWRTGMVRLGAGMLEYFAGQWTAARDSLAEAEATFLERGFGVQWELATTRIWYCFALFQLGEFPELLRRYDAHVEEALRFGNHYAAGSMRTRLNVVWAIRGDRPRVEEDVSHLLRTYPQGSYQVQHFWHLHGRCEGLLYLGDGPAALTLLEEEWPRLRRAQLHRVHLVRSEIQSLIGRAALSAAARESDPRARASTLKRARAAARALRREGAPFVRAWGAMIEAGLVQQQEGPAAATGAIAKALAEVEAAACPLHAVALRCVLGETLEEPDAAQGTDEALAWLRERGVAAPRRFVELLAPGLGRGPHEVGP